MRTTNLKPYIAIATATLLIDWLLGALCASGYAPLWVFVLANIPFGFLYAWMESSWTGTQYVMLGRTVGDTGSLIIFFLVVFAQAFLYCALWHLLRHRRSHTEIARHPDAQESAFRS